MNPIVACFECRKAAIKFNAGFIRDESLYCIDREEEVTYEDGCTFGEKGEHPQLIEQYCIDLSMSVREDPEKWW